MNIFYSLLLLLSVYEAESYSHPKYTKLPNYNRLTSYTPMNHIRDININKIKSTYDNTLLDFVLTNNINNWDKILVECIENTPKCVYIYDYSMFIENMLNRHYPYVLVDKTLWNNHDISLIRINKSYLNSKDYN